MKYSMAEGMYQQKRCGFTLTEISAVMVVVAVVIGGVWSVAKDARESQKETSAVQEEQDITRGILNYLGGRSIPMPSGTADNNITATMIAAQAIPKSYLDSATGFTTVDNPWSTGGADSPILNALGTITGWAHANNGVEIYAITPPGCPAPCTTTNIFRVGFYGVSFLGCSALLTAATMCDSTQQGCPIEVYTAQSAKFCLPTQTGCPSTVTTPGTGLDWQVLGPSTIATLCNANSYTGGVNSVEFDYRM